MNKCLVVGTVVSTIAVSVLAYIFGKNKTDANRDSIIKINGDNEAAFMSNFANCTSNEAKKYILSIQDYEKDLGLCDNPMTDKLDIVTDYDTEIKWVVEHAGLSKNYAKSFSLLKQLGL